MVYKNTFRKCGVYRYSHEYVNFKCADCIFKLWTGVVMSVSYLHVLNVGHTLEGKKKSTLRLLCTMT